ncbi:hypothetical protein VDGL01_03587 [Verticillium dahliae]
MTTFSRLSNIATGYPSDAASDSAHEDSAVLWWVACMILDPIAEAESLQPEQQAPQQESKEPRHVSDTALHTSASCHHEIRPLNIASAFKYPGAVLSSALWSAVEQLWTVNNACPEYAEVGAETWIGSNAECHAIQVTREAADARRD